MDYSVSVKDMGFEHPLLLGAGVCKTLDDIKKACRSAVSGIEIGSVTPEPRLGNTGNNFHAEYKDGVLLYTINSLGMPNRGRQVVEEYSTEAIELAHQSGKYIGINVAADTPRELADMVGWAAQLGYNWVTVNAACPNKFVDGKPASILHYDSEAVKETIRIMDSFKLSPACEVWWKLSPDNDTIGHQPQMLDVLAESKSITGLVANNTVPHSTALDEEGNPCISMVYGGLGGPAVKPKALGDIDRIHKRYKNRFVLIGAGGVTYAKDIRDYQYAGADLVQATSVCWAYGMNFRVFEDILTEYTK